MILNPNPNSNPNLGIQTMEFQILHCLKWPKQGIFKSMDFKSRNFSDYSAFGKNCITSMHDIIKYYINTHSTIFLITHILETTTVRGRRVTMQNKITLSILRKWHCFYAHYKHSFRVKIKTIYWSFQTTLPKTFPFPPNLFP